MRAIELLTESRGVTARAPGETYVNATDPSDILTIKGIALLPDNDEAYGSIDELNAALDQTIPKNEKRVDDNIKNSSTLAAIVASVTDADGKPQHHIRYIKRIPPEGVHTLWKTINGYKFSQGASKESVPIKPTDLIQDENYRTSQQLAAAISTGVAAQVKGTPNEPLMEVIDQAVKAAMQGSTAPIPGAAPYFNVLQKYSGEYLGPLALISGRFNGGDTPKLLAALEITSLAGSQVMFPSDAQAALIDSMILTSTKQEIQVSSKISTGGGAASSLSGVVTQLTPEMEQRFPKGAEIIKILAEGSSFDGPIQIAKMYSIIDDSDVQTLINMNKNSRNIEDLGTGKLSALTQKQGVAPGTLERPDYRVYFHAMAAIVTAMIPYVNAEPEFKGAMMAALNNNNYVQIITKGVVKGNDVILDYYTKFPAVFRGAPQLYNKNYFATGKPKGRLGFKLK
jgi:hypothetical protein